MSIETILEHVRHYLPAQGPIKDFIHHNTLHAFQNQPFEDAVQNAGMFYGTHSYMPLQFYRDAYLAKKITDEELAKSIARSSLIEHERDDFFLKQALFHLVEIKDQTSFTYLLSKKKLNEGEAFRICKIVSDLLPKESHSTQCLRDKCAQQLQSEWDLQINPILFRLTSGFLDQGIGLWAFPSADLSFYDSVKTLAQRSSLPLASFILRQRFLSYFELSAEEIVEKMLQNIVGSPLHFEKYVTETLMAHAGWSGMVNVIELKPSALLKRRHIRLVEFLAVKLMLEWEFIQSNPTQFVPVAFFPSNDATDSCSVEFSASAMSIALLSLSCQIRIEEISPQLLISLQPNLLAAIWQRAFESTYYCSVLSGLKAHNALTTKQLENPSVQAVFCIDDRECSFRRYLEETDPEIETFSTAGFFGLDFFFQSLNDALPVQLCPVQLKPKHLVKEVPADGHHDEFYRQKAHSQKKAISLQRWHDASGSMLLGFVATNTMGHLSAIKLIAALFKPASLIKSLISRKIDVPTELSLLREEGQSSENQVHHHGFTYEEMASRVFAVLRSIGLTQNFATLVTFIAHGSSSINNPHFAAYDCGACSGKPGAPNARAFAAMANLPNVRKLVAEKGIIIPGFTRFIGGYHDTCTDQVHFFDTDALSEEHNDIFQKYLITLERVKGLNARERCRRFAVVDLGVSENGALKEVAHRASVLFEPRPELGHATNTICIVGRRAATRGLFLDRRAFLNSYDPAADDTGQVLNDILSAVIPVCGGINLEYYFSRVDSTTYGCGTKLSHNVCALLGVYNGIDDDLRTGLPIQMTEIHDPIRLLVVIEQTPEIVMKVLDTNIAVLEWVVNEWVHIACLDPTTQEIFVYKPKLGFEYLSLDPIELPSISASQLWAQTSRNNLPLARVGI